jgi:4-hydroxybenzoate polyprenyltransferase
MATRWSGLLLASHPVPTAAVTTLGTVLFASAGNPVRTCVLGALALLTGQLSIGWSNDLIDQRRDRQAGRTDKPIATGTLTTGLLRTACVLAGLLTVPASLALGWRSGLLHLASPLPYLFAFGSLPAVATLALPAPHWPPVWIMLAAGLIGVAAHFANVLPDLTDDLATGVRGLPQRLGSAGAAGTASALMVAVTVLLLVIRPNWPAAAVLVAVIGLAWLVVRGTRPTTAFYATMLCAALNVVLIVATRSWT